MLDVAITIAQSTQRILAREPSKKLTSLHAAATARTDMPRNYQSHHRHRRHCPAVPLTRPLLLRKRTDGTCRGPRPATIPARESRPQWQDGPLSGAATSVRNCRRVSLSVRDVSTPAGARAQWVGVVSFVATGHSR